MDNSPQNALVFNLQTDRREEEDAEDFWDKLGGEGDK